jgi:hypothetical protein
MERMEDGDNRMESIFGRVAELIPDQALLPVLLSSLGSRFCTHAWLGQRYACIRKGLHRSTNLVYDVSCNKICLSDYQTYTDDFQAVSGMTRQINAARINLATLDGILSL